MYGGLLYIARIFLHPLSRGRWAVVWRSGSGALTMPSRAAFSQRLILLSDVLREVLDPFRLLTFSLHKARHR